MTCAAVKDECRRPLRIRGGKERAHLSAVARAEERGLLGVDGVEDYTDILHLGFQRGRCSWAIGCSDSAHVEEDQPRKRRYAQAEISKDWKVPRENHADREGDEHKILWAFADNVVRNRHITAARVPNLRWLHVTSLSIIVYSCKSTPDIGELRPTGPPGQRELASLGQRSGMSPDATGAKSVTPWLARLRCPEPVP